MTGLTNVFVPCAKQKRKINLLEGRRRLFTTILAIICQFFYITTYFILSLLFLFEVLKPIGYQIDILGENYKITNVPILYCAEDFESEICCVNGMTMSTKNGCKNIFRASSSLKLNKKCFEGIQEEHDDFLKDIEQFAVSFRTIEASESFQPELDFVTYCPEEKFRLADLVNCLVSKGFSIDIAHCFIEYKIITIVVSICTISTVFMFLLTILTQQEPQISKSQLKTLMDEVFCNVLKDKFESALSRVHFGLKPSSKIMSNYKDLNKNFLDGCNQGVLEFAICKENVDLLKYASDLGLVKADITCDLFQMALEKGNKKIVKYLVSVFLTIDYAGNPEFVHLHNYSNIHVCPSIC